MSEPAWLLFLDGNTSLKHFFYGINIPFDCKFLVAQPRENRIFLTEVYRVAEGTSLLTHSYGLWESNNGTILATAKLYERRNNLYGVRMKGVSLHVSVWWELFSHSVMTLKNNNPKWRICFYLEFNSEHVFDRYELYLAEIKFHWTPPSFVHLNILSF